MTLRVLRLPLHRLLHVFFAILSVTLLASCASVEEKARRIDKYEFPPIPEGYGRLLFWGEAEPSYSDEDYCHVAIDGYILRNPKNIKTGFFFVDVPAGVHVIKTAWNAISGEAIQSEHFLEGRENISEYSFKRQISIASGDTLQVNLLSHQYVKVCNPSPGKDIPNWISFSVPWSVHHKKLLPVPEAGADTDLITYQ